HVHHSWRPRVAGNLPGPPGRLSTEPACARWQRGCHSTPAGYLWRIDGCAVYLLLSSRPDLRELAASLPAARLAGKTLAGAGRGHLGGPRRRTALPALSPDVLGRL